MSVNDAWLYGAIRAFNEKHYRNLLTPAHIITGRKPLNLGTKEEPDIRIVYVLQSDRRGKKFALEQDHIESLPILVTRYEPNVRYRDDVYEYITSFMSAKFREERVFSLRELVDDICGFEHSSKDDFTIWKIIVLAGLCSRLSARVSSAPGFGKDSVVNVVGDLCGNALVVPKSSMAKLKYVLTNKVVMLNEIADLKGNEHHDLEQFLLASGALANTYTNNTRASEGTTEVFNISKLSLIITYNDLDCYAEGAKYFDTQFQRAVPDRFIPFRMKGRITEQLNPNPPNVQAIADENTDHYKAVVRSVMWYQSHWHEEADERSSWRVKTGSEYGLPMRWAANFDTIRQFVILYSQNEVEAQRLVGIMYNRHLDYANMVGGSRGLFDGKHPRENEDAQSTFTEETITE
jgi:hypothetical protein